MGSKVVQAVANNHLFKEGSHGAVLNPQLEEANRKLRVFFDQLVEEPAEKKEESWTASSPDAEVLSSLWLFCIEVLPVLSRRVAVSDGVVAEAQLFAQLIDVLSGLPMSS